MLSKITILIEVIMGLLSVIKTVSGMLHKKTVTAAKSVKNKVIKPKIIIPDTKPIINIGISAGHWGKNYLDSGAISPILGIKEAVIAKDLSVELYRLFKDDKGFNPILLIDPENQVSGWSYEKRVAVSDARGDKYYLALHFNSFPQTPKKNGFLIGLDTEDFAKNEKTLTALCKKIITNLNSYYNIGIADWDTVKDGAMAGLGKTVFELYKPKADTLYFELGFISNLEWEKVVANQAEIKNMAKLIYDGFVLARNEGTI